MLSRRLLRQPILKRFVKNVSLSTFNPRSQVPLTATWYFLSRPEPVMRHHLASRSAFFVSKDQHVRYSSSDSGSSDTASAVNEVSKLVQAHRIVLFMKGNPSQPQCGFSNVVCRLLEMHGVLEKASQDREGKLFASYDILQDEELRSAAKLFTDWPTFPQLYVDGRFIGGCDILLDMHKSGQLVEELERSGIGSVLQTASSPNNGDKN